jgi:hypothetical protein
MSDRYGLDWAQAQRDRQEPPDDLYGYPEESNETEYPQE